jgi:hypothetical protein
VVIRRKADSVTVSTLVPELTSTTIDSLGAPRGKLELGEMHPVAALRFPLGCYIARDGHRPGDLAVHDDRAGVGRHEQALTVLPNHDLNEILQAFAVQGAHHRIVLNIDNLTVHALPALGQQILGPMLAEPRLAGAEVVETALGGVRKR